EYSIRHIRTLGWIATQMTVLFGVINWLGRPPSAARQLIGAVNLYFLVKILANLAVQLQGGNPNNLALASYALAATAFVMAVLRARRHPEPESATRSVLNEGLRFLNPALFTITAMGLALVVAQADPPLGAGLGVLSVVLYVLRT